MLACRTRRSKIDSPPRIYANFTACKGGPFDVSLSFGYRVGEDDPELMTEVAMSWQHLSVLVKILQAQLDAYQVEVGELPDLEKLREE